MDVKKTIAIFSMPITMPEDMGIEASVELDIDIPDIVLVGEPDIDIVMLILLSMMRC